jgi:hypothetical protein
MFDDLRGYKGKRQQRRERALRKAREYHLRLGPMVTEVLSAYSSSLKRSAITQVYASAVYMDNEEEYIPTARWCLEEDVSLNKQHCRKDRYVHKCVTIEVNGHLRPLIFKVRLKNPPCNVDRLTRIESGACVSGETNDLSRANLVKVLRQLTMQLKELQ